MDESVRTIMSDIKLLGGTIFMIGTFFSMIGVLISRFYLMPKIDKVKKCLEKTIKESFNSFEKRQDEKYKERFFNKLTATEKFKENSMNDAQYNKDIDELKKEIRGIYTRIDALK